MRSETLKHPSFSEAFRFWLKLGFISFGGPAGQIAIMQTELVERRRWISQSRFLHALNFCMLLPGPEAQQLAIYIGWLLHRTWGGIVAGALFVVPSMFVLWGLSFVYAAYGTVPWIAAIFYGLKPAVLAIVAFAVIRLGRKALGNPLMWIIAAGAFVGIFFLKVPFPVIVLSAGIIGFLGGRLAPALFSATNGPGTIKGENELSVLDDDGETPAHAKPSLSRAVRLCVIWGLLWWLPILALGFWFGWNHTLFQEGIFFSKAAVVTFGGAYAVLPYVAQQAVENYHWLGPGQMMDGLGLAETTPGPLIMVLQFVGFMGGWKLPMGLSPLVAATLGAFITTWATFVPCFLWIFLGAPHIEQLRGNKSITSTLSTVTAAVVGVILNLAVWFGLHVLFPEGKAIDWFAVTVGLVAFFGMLKFKWNVVPVVLGSWRCGVDLSIHRALMRSGERACARDWQDASSSAMKLGLSHGKATLLRAATGTAFISGFLFALMLAAAPHLHERIHQPVGTSHECAVTLIASGKYQVNETPVLVSAPRPAVQFSKIPTLPSVWVPAPFLGASILEHAPPAHS